MAPVYIRTEKEFDESVPDSKLPAIVVFSVGWCSPCKDMENTVTLLSEEEEYLSVFIVDSDALPQLAEKHEIKGFPTTVLFVNGEEKCRRLGMLSRRTLKEMLSAE